MLKRLSHGLAQAWIILGITLGLLLLVDHGLRLVLPAPGSVVFDASAPAAPDRAQAQAVASDSWIGAYWKEHARSKGSAWHSYVYWRREPYAGQLIQIDANGFRHTPMSMPDEQRTLWLFGGSTVWGTGNRDQGTLAAQLEQLYAERAPALGVRVRNFGESGYVSQQSALAFQLALRCPEPPADLAIFLDGPNDVFATLQSGTAGNPQNEDHRRAEFNSSSHLATLLKALALRLEGIGRLVRRTPAAAGDELIGRWAAQTALAYFATARQTRAIAHDAGVEVLFAWQPTLFDRARPSGDEIAILGASPADHVRLQRATRAQIRDALQSGRAPEVSDLGGVFDEITEPVYFDFVHLSEHGQHLLAEQLYALSVARMNALTPHGPRLDRCSARPLSR